MASTATSVYTTSAKGGMWSTPTVVPILPRESLRGAPTAAQPASVVRANSSTALKNSADTRVCTASSNSGSGGVRKSDPSRANDVAQYVSCVGRAVNAGASGRRSSVIRSASRRRDDNCAVHAERSDRSVCGSSRDKSVGGQSRNIAAYCVRRSCTSSRLVSIYFFMYRTHASGVSNAFFHLSPCGGDVEHLDTTRKEREGEFASGKLASAAGS